MTKMKELRGKDVLIYFPPPYSPEFELDQNIVEKNQI